MFTLPRAELLGQHIWAKFPRRGHRFPRAIRTGVAGQHDVQFEPFLTRRSASWFDARVFPSTQGLAVYFRDITASDRRVRAAHERGAFPAALNATNDAIWDWDLATNAVWWNEGFEKLFGYRREDVDPTVKSWTDSSIRTIWPV